VGVILLGSAVGSLEAFVVYGIGRRLVSSAGVALAAAAAVPLLPILVTRLSLSYFPATLGAAVDAIALLVLLARYEAMDRPRNILVLAALLALAFLSYTQSPLNFGAVLGVFLPLALLRDRSAASLRRALGTIGAFGLAGAVSLGLFYWRYLPGLKAMRQGAPQVEEDALRDRPKEVEAAPSEPDEKNPFFGPDLDLWRGLRKAGFRLWVFYGVYAFAVPAGLFLLLRRTSPADSLFVLAWGLHYLVMNLGSGGLPSPNLLRYNKEMEFAAPLFCLALATLGAWIYERSRVAAALYGGGFLVFGASEAARYAGGTLERTL
jgi:hypothetical protein